MLGQINMMIWNIRGASRKDSIRHAEDLSRNNKVVLLVILEPFSPIDRLESVRFSLHFQLAKSFPNGKIWIF